MTKLQRLVLDALDQLGDMTDHELEVACLISPNRRGGFRATLRSLFSRGYVTYEEIPDAQIKITKEGVFAIEADNYAQLPDRV